MLKIDIFSTKMRRILSILILAILTITITGCKSKVVDTLPYDENYLTVGNYSVTKGEVWNELKWNAADLFDTKAQEAVLNKYIEDIKNVMSNPSDSKYTEYKTRLQSYLVEDVYDLTFSLESHDEEIEDLKADAKTKSIKKYADEVYQNYKVDIKTEEIINALEANDYDKLSPLYENYYLNYAKELLAIDKLNEEIEEKNKEALEDDDEDTVGYFTKSEIVSKYKDKYLHQGYVDVIMIKFASETEAKETLRAFGLIVNDENQLCYLTNTPSNFNDYKKYYDEFDFDEKTESDYLPLDSYYGSSIILQLYIAMYNYIYTYRDAIENIDVNMQNIIDQRSTTAALIETYNDLEIKNKDEEDKRIDDIMKQVNSDGPNEFVRYTAEEINDIDSSLYDYIYETLQTPEETIKDGEEQSDKINRYTTSPKSINSNYYMIYKVDYEENVADDKLYDSEDDTDELYNKIVKDENLYSRIIKDLTNEDLTSSYIDEKLNAEMENVKVKIFDKSIEIAYSVDHSDYNKTLSKAPDTNTIATFEYDGSTISYYLTTEDGKGLWDILEYRNGTAVASNLISTKMIKDSEEYKSIPQEDIDAYYKSIEYVLASFANDALASNGYPASIGKYNFLMLYYHTADVDQIVDDVFKVSNASSQILTNYIADDTLEFFNYYNEIAYKNFFSVNATDLKIYLDKDEDGEADEIDWNTEVVTIDGEFKGMLLKDVAKELVETIYTKVAATSGDHKTALTDIVSTYNSTSRFNPKEGGQFDDDEYDPIGSEWDYAKFKRTGLVISTEDLTVTNSSTDIDINIMNKLRDVYMDNNLAEKEYSEVILENPNDENALVEANNCLNYFLITGYEKPASAKFEAYKDVDGIYQNIVYKYNEDYITVENVYNDGDMLNKNQIEAYILEYLASSTSNLLPTDISTSLTNFLSPILTRYQDTATQIEIIYNYVSNGDNSAYQFADSNNNERFETLREINIRVADDYKTYENEEDEARFNNFAGWWDKLKELSNGGNK